MDRSSKYYGTPKGIFNIIKKNWRRKHEDLEMTQSQFLDWYSGVAKTCHYCGIDSATIQLLKSRGYPLTRLQIDRTDNSKPYQIGNIALACSICNAIKSDFLTEDEMMQIGASVISKKWRALIESCETIPQPFTQRNIPKIKRERRLKECCKYGHLFDAANTHVLPDGSRRCRACDRRRHKISNEKAARFHGRRRRKELGLFSGATL